MIRGECLPACQNIFAARQIDQLGVGSCAIGSSIHSMHATVGLSVIS